MKCVGTLALPVIKTLRRFIQSFPQLLKALEPRDIRLTPRVVTSCRKMQSQSLAGDQASAIAALKIRSFRIRTDRGGLSNFAAGYPFLIALKLT
jgi:hypothetical protein